MSLATGIAADRPIDSLQSLTGQRLVIIFKCSPNGPPTLSESPAPPEQIHMVQLILFHCLAGQTGGSSLSLSSALTWPPSFRSDSIGEICSQPERLPLRRNQARRCNRRVVIKPASRAKDWPAGPPILLSISDGAQIFVVKSWRHVQVGAR